MDKASKHEKVIRYISFLVVLSFVAVNVTGLLSRYMHKSGEEVSKILLESNVVTIYRFAGEDIYYDLEGNCVDSSGNYLVCEQRNIDVENGSQIEYVLLLENNISYYVGEVSNRIVGVDRSFGTANNIMLVNSEMEFRFYWAQGLYKETLVSLTEDCFYSFDNKKTTCDNDVIAKGIELRKEHFETMKEWGITARELDVYFAWLFENCPNKV